MGGLRVMSDLFRLALTQRRDPAIETWFRKHSDELGRLGRTWFGRIRRGGREVREVLHDGCPTACVADAAFAYVAVFRAHVNVGFFRGSELPDPHGLLDGTGRVMRHVKLRPGREFDGMALQKLIHDAYTDMKERVQAEDGRPGSPDEREGGC